MSGGGKPDFLKPSNEFNFMFLVLYKYKQRLITEDYDNQNMRR